MIDPNEIPEECFYAWSKSMEAGETAKQAMAAALSAWPGLRLRFLMGYTPERGVYDIPTIHLPLPEKGKNND